MTEKEFDHKIEDMATRFEHRIEASADKFDRGITCKYNESRIFRLITKGLSVSATVGLLIGGKYLVEKGRKDIAICCIILGAVGLGVELLHIFIFRRRK